MRAKHERTYLRVIALVHCQSGEPSDLDLHPPQASKTSWQGMRQERSSLNMKGQVGEMSRSEKVIVPLAPPTKTPT